MTDSQLTYLEQMENKTETPITEFNEVTKTMTDEQILADNYIISQSISKIILKKYSKFMKKNATKIIIFVILSMIIYGCVTINVNTPQKSRNCQTETVKDSSDCNSRWLFQY